MLRDLENLNQKSPGWVYWFIFEAYFKKTLKWITVDNLSGGYNRISSYLCVFFGGANSTLEWHIKCMWVNFSWNPSESWNLPYLRDCVKFTWFYFSRLWFSYEHSRKRMHLGKTWYRVLQETLGRKNFQESINYCFHKQYVCRWVPRRSFV